MPKERQATKSVRESFTCTIRAQITPGDAYADICDVWRWWTAGFTGSAKTRGDRWRAQFGQMYFDFEVVEAVPNQRIVWKVTDCYLDMLDNKEWNGTSIAWDISSRNGVTTVKMTHQGLTQDFDCYEICEAGWSFYVGKSLQALLTNGEGLPDGM
ncbi:MAG: SRPBCC family protein [Bacillota bacterium]